MDAIQFITRYKRTLQNRVDDISISVTSGGVSDMETYRSMIGEIQGLTYALDELQTLLKKDDYDEDPIRT
jgi:hypothetical protein|tara:strand:- start:3771 stop:3980 length:210 start_codon:yes stop_codon:yes gene_type:complete